MIQLTPKEFEEIRKAIAAAHIFNLEIIPILKQRHHAFNKNERQLIDFTLPAIAAANKTINIIARRENRDLDPSDATPINSLTEADRLNLRDELENVSALALPDLVYEMVCALGELPMYHEVITAEPPTAHRAAILMAWAWEAGRRYGVQQAMAIVDNTTDDYKNNTMAILDAAWNNTLDLPPIEPAKPGPTLVTDDAKATTDTIEDDKPTQPTERLN